MRARDIGGKEIKRGQNKSESPVSLKKRIAKYVARETVGRLKPNADARKKDNYKVFQPLLKEKLSEEELGRKIDKARAGAPQILKLESGNEAIVIVSAAMSSREQNAFADGNDDVNFVRVTLNSDGSAPQDEQGYYIGEPQTQHTVEFQLLDSAANLADKATEAGVEAGIGDTVNHVKSSVSRAIDDAGHFR